MLERSLHFPIKPGVVAAWNTRTVVIVALLDGSSARVRDVATGDRLDVPVEELHGLQTIGQLENNEARWSQVRDSTQSEWKQARRRERVLRKLLLSNGERPEGIECACKALNLSRRTIYRLLANYRSAEQTSTAPRQLALIAISMGMQEETPESHRKESSFRRPVSQNCIRFIDRAHYRHVKFGHRHLLPKRHRTVQ